MSDHLETALPATKSSRANAVHYTPTGPDRGTAIIDQTGKGHIAEYIVIEFKADGGRGFRVYKAAGSEDYHVFLPLEEVADAGLAFDSCDCHGFVRHGHCKHVDSIRAIVDRGLIRLPVARPKPATIPMAALQPAASIPGEEADAIRQRESRSVNDAKDMLVRACRVHGITGRAAIIAEWRRVVGGGGNPFDTADLDRM